jgi:UDP-N-acetylglucosamine 2-epimerase
MKKFLSIVGVRPQFIKAATVCSAVERHNRAAAAVNQIQHELLNTGQHYDFGMADVFFEQLSLPRPDYSLGVGSGLHGAQTAAMLDKIEPVLMKSRPDYVIVYGDTNSTLAGALAAAKLHIPVAHVESGLRSFNRRMPEEINRIATDHISDVLFCPTHAAVEQLKKEGITEHVFFSGDVMLDAVLEYSELAERRSAILSSLDLKPRRYVLITIHRAENTDSRERMSALVETLCAMNYPAVFAMHPRLRAKLDAEPAYRSFRDRLERATHLKVIHPVSYLDMLHLERNAVLVMTDSGGVQKECYFVATPCLTLREETEWIETLTQGWNRVVGTEPARILPLVWSCDGAAPKEQPDLAVFGDGRAADAILNILLEKDAVYACVQS